MKQVIQNDLPLWQFENLCAQTTISHFVSTRWDSTSVNRDSFTLSLSSTPDQNKVRGNRIRLAAAMNIAPTDLFFPSQVHGTRIAHVNGDTNVTDLQDTDALITNEKGICLAVLSADCVPILLYDPKNEVVAVVHSGWRGTVSRILTKTLEEMARKYETKGEDLVAGIGPSISCENYEVGSEVIEAVDRSFSHDHSPLTRRNNGKAYLDLWDANAIQLREFGVAPAHIEISNLCTVKYNDHFFSARKGDGGRFAAGIMNV